MVPAITPLIGERLPHNFGRRRVVRPPDRLRKTQRRAPVESGGDARRWEARLRHSSYEVDEQGGAGDHSPWRAVATSIAGILACNRAKAPAVRQGHGSFCRWRD